MHEFSPIVPAVVPCKCCTGTASLFGVVDFNKNCEAARALHKLAERLGLKIRSAQELSHVMFAKVPAFARHIPGSG